MSHLLRLNVSSKLFIAQCKGINTTSLKNIQATFGLKLQERKIYANACHFQGNKEQIVAAVKTQTLPNVPITVGKIITDASLSNSESKEVLICDPKDTKWHQCPRIYSKLSKLWLSVYVVVTADAGYCLAPTLFDAHVFVPATIGTLLCAFSANSFNQIWEIKLDSLMDRTKTRPLVTGVITPFHAKTFAVVSGITGVSCLYFGVNFLTATLGALNIGLYALVYTPLKQLHWSNTWVGSIVGAIPPVMGWTAATGSLDAGAFIFAGILYAWQFPHFFALVWRRRADYARGSYKMLPLSHPEWAKRCVLAHALMLCGLSVAAPLTGVTSLAFLGMSAPVNGWLTYRSWSFYRHGNSKYANKLYQFSLYYIILISTLLIVDRIWSPKSEKLLVDEKSSAT